MGQANLAQEEESTLMLLERGEILFESVLQAKGDISKSPVSMMGSTLVLKKGDTRSSPVSLSPVHLVEEKLFTHFNDEVKMESRRWVLDCGALNHMMGIREVFIEIDTNVCDTVRFGDGSMVQIERIGTILFVCKNGEHMILAGVYLIPKLTTNIVSLGQLDGLGFEVLIKFGVMWVHDESHRLLAKVQCSSNWLYVLTMEVTQPVNLMAKGVDNAWLWHAWFRHLNFWALRRLAREDMVKGLPKVEQVEQLCIRCLVGKQRRTSNQRMSMDTWGYLWIDHANNAHR
jgi:hypothetical protein